MRPLSVLGIVLVAGGVWGGLAYALYAVVVGPMPLSIAAFLAFTVLFPSAVSHMVIASVFRVRVSYGPFPIYVYVANPLTETFGFLFSSLIGIAVAYSLWRILKRSRME